MNTEKKDFNNISLLLFRLSVQLNLRTYASSGLICYMAHQNQVDYAALQLLGGQLYFSFDLGKGKAVTFHPVIISDGKWHMVGIKRFVLNLVSPAVTEPNHSAFHTYWHQME